MRVAFFGTPAPAVPALEALLAATDVDLVAAVTNPDRPSGRGHRLTPPPVKVTAAAAGVPVWQPQRPVEVVAALAELAVDACAVVAYGALLPPALLAAGGRGFVNLHFSVLPAWRGAAPAQHTILAGGAGAGVTCFVLDAGMDTGPVLCAVPAQVGPDETAGELVARLAGIGAPLLVDALRGLVDGSLTPVPQDDTHASLAPKIRPDDARLDWFADATGVHRAVRAYNPAPGAWTTLRGERLKVHRVGLAAAEGSPGTVVALSADGPVVACGAGAVVLRDVQPAGKPRITGVDLDNGYRPLGETLR